MKSETEVIFRQDGRVLLQADGGWCHLYDTPAAAAWDAVRSMKGSDPDYGWPNNMPEQRTNTEYPAFARGYDYLIKEPKQSIWYPKLPGPEAEKSKKDFAEIYFIIQVIPVSVLAACERGDVEAIKEGSKSLEAFQLSGLLKAVLSIDFSEATQKEIALQAAEKPYMEPDVER